MIPTFVTASCRFKPALRREKRRVTLHFQKFKLSAACVFLLLITSCSSNPKELLESGKQYLSRESHDEAIIQFRNALKQAPQLFEAHYLLGLTLIRKGELDEATLELAQAVTL